MIFAEQGRAEPAQPGGGLRPRLMRNARRVQLEEIRVTALEACRLLCGRAVRAGLLDPLSELPPRDERSLSAPLCLYHQAGRIDWAQVPLLLPSGAHSGATAASVLGRPGYLCSEYPLFWETPEHLAARGSMTPDFLFVSDDRRVAALIESKIGAGLTHRGDAFGGQLGRYARYLSESSVPEVYLVLLTSETFISRVPPWYVTELEEGARGCPRVQARVILWEAVLAAIGGVQRPNPAVPPPVRPAAEPPR